ncbi:hypothetical protein EC950943_4110A, partial [Escherichia coli 95.0943]
MGCRFVTLRYSFLQIFIAPNNLI